MGLIDDRLAKEQPQTPRVISPVTRYVNARFAQKLRFFPKFYLDYFFAVVEVMKQQGIGPSSKPAAGEGNFCYLDDAESDQMDEYAERLAPASEFVTWIRTNRGL